jgi:hypothetical protein
MCQTRETLAVLVAIGFVACGFQSTAFSAEPAAAVAEIEKLGGWVRKIAINSKEVEVEFSLGTDKLTDEGLAHVAKLKNVVTLNVKGSKITSAGLVHVKGLTSLRQLHLEKTQIDDAGIEHLKGLAELEYLNLYGTKVTDKSLEHLKGLKKLRRLYVWQTGITPKGVAMLSKALPGLTIVEGVDLSKLPAAPVRPPRKPLKWVAAKKGEKLKKSVSGANISVEFVNKSSRRVKLYWISYGGERTLYGQIDPGKSRDQNTYSGNTWLITDANDKALGHFFTGSEDAIALIPK